MNPSLKQSIADAREALAIDGERFETAKWQSIEAPAAMLELLNYSFTAEVPQRLEALIEQTQPNLPWAEDHFQERIGQQPTNPGETFHRWPYYRGNVEQHKAQGEFSHTYMERMWPKYAGNHGDSTTPHMGIRETYGDLSDVINLLRKDPTTRQAFLPIWFPEDTGNVAQVRVPCTLGYQFMVRSNRLHCWYYIRACDAIRHFQDDVYLAARLAQHVALQAGGFTPGFLSMHIASFHCWDQERGIL